MPSWLLKLLAAAMTLASTAGSAAYVSMHVKNPAAPLHPGVVPQNPLSFTSVRAGSTGGQLTLQPSVQTSDNQAPLTFTSVS